jgi:Fe-S-cluster containining protein
MRRPKHGCRAERSPLPIVRLGAAPQSNDALTATVPVKLAGERMQFSITIPNRAASIRELLPVFRGMTDAVVGVAVRAVEKQGEKISCCAGCGACCRQPVPISLAEARAIARLVDMMPEPRRQQVRQRFADAIVRLDQAGLLNRLQETNTGEETTSIGLAYFRLGIPCPFLESESCSIHADRPVACREYLVTSPAEECSRPEAERVCGVPMPAQVGRALRNVEQRESGTELGWVPLILALEWSAKNPEPPPTTPAAEVLKQFLVELQHEGGSNPDGA